MDDFLTYFTWIYLCFKLIPTCNQNWIWRSNILRSKCEY